MDDLSKFDRISETGKRYYTRIDEDSGDVIRIYESGTEYNETKKKIMAGATDYRITTDNAAELVMQRHEKTRQAIADGLVQAAKEHGLPLKTAPEVVGVAAAGLVKDILKGDGRLKERTDTLLQLARAGDLLPDGRAPRLEVTDQKGNSISGSPGEVRALIEALRGDDLGRDNVTNHGLSNESMQDPAGLVLDVDQGEGGEDD